MIRGRLSRQYLFLFLRLRLDRSVGPLAGYFACSVEELHGWCSVGGYAEEDAGVSFGVAEA